MSNKKDNKADLILAKYENVEDSNGSDAGCCGEEDDSDEIDTAERILEEARAEREKKVITAKIHDKL